LIDVKLKTRTPLHQAAKRGKTEVTKVLLEAGASLSAVDYDVIKHSVKLRQSNIKLFK
jgi:ankyrin repeat protein